MARTKKKEKEDKKPTSLEVAKKAILKEFGEGVLTFLGDHEDLKIDAISTGCLGLDASLGKGGFARGRLYEVFGPNSSGKSTLALSVCMQALLRGMEIVYIDAEHSLDPQLVRNMGKEVGVNPDKINLVQAYTGDANLEIAEKMMATGEVDVAVVDSVSSLLPKSMAEGEISDNYVGELARLMSKACMKLTPVANRTNTLLIFINQIRFKIGAWGDPKTTSGGEALGYYTTGRIKVEGGEFKNSRIVDSEGVVVGHNASFEIVKNKLAPPWRKASIGLIYGKGYDFVSESVDVAVDMGIIDQVGNWFELDGNKRQGKNNFVAMLKENKELYDATRQKVLLGLGLAVDE